MEKKHLVWSFDTDGVLNDYPAVWLEFIARQTGKNFTSVDMAKIGLSEKYDQLKHEYRLSDFKYSIPINPEARETIAVLRRRGDCVYISTSRPLADYPHMRRRSLEWLRNGGIEFDGLLEKSAKNLKENGCEIHVDDELEALLPLKDHGIQCILYQRIPSAVPLFPETVVIKDFRELFGIFDPASL